MDGFRHEVTAPDGTVRGVFIHDSSSCREICLNLSEWSGAPLNKFGLYIENPSAPSAPSCFSNLPPPTNIRVLEDDRYIFPMAKTLESTPMSYRARLLSPTLFDTPSMKPRLSSFIFSQCRDLLTSSYFNTFFPADELCKIAALSIAASGDIPASLPSLNDLVSEKALSKLSTDDWSQAIKQELADLIEQRLDSDTSPPVVSPLEQVKFQKDFCVRCFENRFFVIEIWSGTALLLDMESNTDPDSEVPSSAYANAAKIPPPPLTDIPESTPVLLGINRFGINVICESPSPPPHDPPPPPTIYSWDLYNVKCWSYSKTSFSWTELDTDIEYSILVNDGYTISGLLMDYALAIVAETGGSEPPCLKYQTLDQLGWKGKIALDDGKLTNSLKARDQRPLRSPNAKLKSSPSIDDDITPPEPSKPWHIRKTTSSITIAWEPPKKSMGKILRYEVRFGIRFVFGWHNAPPVSNNSEKTQNLPTCVVSGLDKDTSYVFQTRSMNEKGYWSDWSNQSDPITTKKENTPDPTHLVVLSHGICQNEGHMAYLAEKIQTKLGPTTLTLCSKANAFIGSTRDGVNIGGHRLALEIVEFTKHHPDLKQISMVGHNIGGLYCRYAAGALYANDMFKILKPTNFVTLGTPHLGSGGTLLPDDMASLLCGETGEQLSLKDGEASGEEPMLMKICHRQFLQALLHFPNRVCYANVKDDGRVAIPSGSIRLKNPYEHFADGYLQSKCSREFPNIIVGEDFEQGDSSHFEDDFDPSAEDNFVSSGSPSKSRAESEGVTAALRLDSHDKFKRDMFTALNEVGWRRRDVLNYGHDQLLQDPKWWITDRTPDNALIKHLTETFLVARDVEDGGEVLTEDPDIVEGLETVTLTDLSNRAQTNKTQDLELHPDTQLFYFK
ncbi:hypothetical protein TrST_g3829 [Triparma strigata]|uniref:Fibronectin type-III domain-containing protein n=1 Tax=Triparma strigata TaxID=1606541 RepID=A0A9W7EV86_9STRA|nr:hypothetical protein TrST_g3829 [Triparma strigata]